MLYCPQELWDQREEAQWEGGARGIRFTAGHGRTMFSSIFDCFTGDSLSSSSLKSERGSSGRALKPLFALIWPATDCSLSWRLEPVPKLRQRWSTLSLKRTSSRCRILLRTSSFKHVTDNSSSVNDLSGEAKMHLQNSKSASSRVCFAPVCSLLKKRTIHLFLISSEQQPRSRISLSAFSSSFFLCFLYIHKPNAASDLEGQQVICLPAVGTEGHCKHSNI